jgi:hypothetical protein
LRYNTREALRAGRAMNRTLVFLLLLALIALGVALLLSKPYEAGQGPMGDRRSNDSQPAAVSERLPASRSEIAPHREAGRRTAIAPRGVHGRVLDERALPVRGALVSLIPHTELDQGGTLAGFVRGGGRPLAAGSRPPASTRRRPSRGRIA